MIVDEELKQEILDVLKTEDKSALRISKEIKEGWYKTLFYLELLKNEDKVEMVPVHKHQYRWRIKK